MLNWRTAAGLLIAYLLFELLIRHLASGWRVVDPQFGWIWRDMTVVHRLEEGWGVSHWRDDGTRVHAPAPAAAPRVLVLGDSFTEALQVNDDEVYSARLHGVDTLNTGQSSWSMADYLVFAPEMKRRFHPAWTIIQVGPPDFGEDAFDSTKTHFTPQLDVVVVQPTFGRISAVLMKVRLVSSVLDYAIVRWHAFLYGSKMPPLFRAADAERTAETKKPEKHRQWPVTEEMKRVVAQYDGRVTFLYCPRFKDEVPDVEREWTATCKSARLSCVNMRDVFPEFQRRGDAPFGFPNSGFGAGHMNARGHAAAAALLQTEIERQRALGLF